LEQLALDIGMPIGSMRERFDTEIKTARVRAILDNLDRLHEAADSGNVSAMKALARMMQPATPEVAEDDTWADIADNISSRNVEIH
jgi:hypothetical protein